MRLPSAISGEATVSARLYGDANASPVLWPGTQIVSGQLVQTADYCTRSILARDARKAILIYDAFTPTGSSVKAEIQVDSGAWQAMPQTAQTQQGEGIVELRHELALSDAELIKVRLTLTGTAKARPEVYDIRLMAVS